MFNIDKCLFGQYECRQQSKDSVEKQGRGVYAVCTYEEISGVMDCRIANEEVIISYRGYKM